MSLPIDIKFRLEAAARVLERAARRADDPNLRNRLLRLASSLRAAAETGTLMEIEADTETKTIDDIIEEIRELIWRGSSRQPERLRDIKDIEVGILKPFEDFERLLEELDRKLMEMLP